MKVSDALNSRTSVRACQSNGYSFLGDARVPMIEKCPGEKRMTAAVDGGCGRASGAKQVRRNLYKSRFASDLRDESDRRSWP